VLLLTERSDFVTRMAPTTALSRTVSIDGAPWLGLVEGEAGHPELVRFSFDAQLTGDPYLIDLVNQRLDHASDRASGTFSNWKLAASMEKIPGVEEGLTQVEVAGNVLRVSAAVRSDQANLSLWKLGTPAGIHFDLKWECTGPEGQKISGSLGKLALPGPLAATAALTAPPEAVEMVVDNPFKVANEFYQAKNQDLFRRFTITNNLPGVDPDRGGAMRFVEIRVQTAEVGSETWQDLRSYYLSAGGTKDSQIKLSVLHSPDKQMRLRLSGTAYYENGSHTDLVPFETTDPSINITPQELKGT
jgi:hypothetical protein